MENGMKIVHCWIEHPVRSLDQTFTYLCKEDVEPGCRIEVPFGSRRLIGFVDSVEETEKSKEEIEADLGFHLKYVSRIIDQEPLITEELHDLALWMRKETLSTAISCFQAMLPGKVKPSSGGEKKIRTSKWVKLSEKEVNLTPKQLEAYLTVQKKGQMLYSDLRKLYPGQAHALLEKGALVSFEKEKEAEEISPVETSSPFVLSPGQKKAMDEIESSKDEVYLIRGVTGSGKTEIYLQLAARQLAKGRQVLILVPEIALTPQMIERVSSRFGAKLAIYHSGLNAQQKYEQYRRVRTGKASIVVGTRSAVFLPFENLGLIVLDEEHDSSYKQENQPCYHCRDVAVWRGKFHHCKVILGSATPTLDSYARALKGVYHLIRLDERINQTLPDVTIVPMKTAMKHGESYILSNVLKEKIQDRLNRKEQVILLLNRRGYNTLLRCKDCGAVIQCPHCELAMSWHRDEKKLKCHTCGFEMRLPYECPTCHSRSGFASYGFGTERLEQEVQNSFPGVRTLRMDADTTSRKDSHKKILEAFGRGEADVLLGTQMIAKGLDYPGVTLVGVVNGDEGLNRTDFRSCETTFDLLMQAGGRSGRGEKNGEVVYQVYDPDHYAVQCAARQDYDTFYQNEMRFRHAGMYPPYTYLISLTVIGMDQRNVEREALALKNGITGPFQVIGVISLLRIQDRCRCRVLLKGRNLDTMREAVRRFLNETKLDMKGLRIDVNPMVLD
jgi:primosomal protein N' (replication factor Y)